MKGEFYMGNAYMAKKLEPISLAVAGTFYTDWIKFYRQEKAGWQFDAIDVSGVTATIGFDFKAHDLADPCAYEVSGSVVAVAVEAATAVITGSIGKLTFTSISTDSSGGEITVMLVDGVSAGAEVATVTTTYAQYNGQQKVAQRVISVSVETGVSTAAQIKAAIEANAEADALITAAVTIAGAMEEAVAVLTDGSKFFDLVTAAPQIRAKIVVSVGVAGASLQPYVAGKE
jgi:hypothetical protein